MLSNNMKETLSFDHYQSKVIKGVAILLMLCYHCFLPVDGNYDSNTVSFFPFTESQFTAFATFGQVCVSLFAFVSGYGLFLSYHKWKRLNEKEHASHFDWIWRRYIQTFSRYWIVVILAWIVCSLIDGRPFRIYFSYSRLMGPFYAFVDFLGLSRIFDTPYLLNTWWYMGAALCFILMVPFIYAAFNQIGCFCTFSLLVIIPRLFRGFPGNISPLVFLPAFCLGMICSRIDFFGRLSSLIKRSKGRLFIFSGLSVTAGLLFYLLSIRMSNEKYWDFKFGIFPLAYILCIYLIISRIPILKSILSFLGEHSANIYLVHTFIRQIYGRTIIYSQRHCLLIIATLLLCSLLCSFAIESLKRIIKYNELIEWLKNLSFSVKT